MFSEPHPRSKVCYRRFVFWNMIFPVAVLAYCLLVATQFPLAQADRIRRHPSPERIDEAIALDPLNAYGYTMKAELLDAESADSSESWIQAGRLSPRDSEILIRRALISEKASKVDQAEWLFLQAAALDQTWKPRFSLTNFYLRQQRLEAVVLWAGKSAERASSDIHSLFRLLSASGLPMAEIQQRILPRNRKVIHAFLDHLNSLDPIQDISEAARDLASFIPHASPDWPGLEARVDSKKMNFPALPLEEQSLRYSVERLIRGKDFANALSLNNFLAQRFPAVAKFSNEEQLIVDPEFRDQPTGNLLDWNFNSSSELRFQPGQLPGGLKLHLSGKQPESIELLSQVLLVPADFAFRLEFKSDSAQLVGQTGLSWSVRSFNSSAFQIDLGSISARRNSITSSSILSAQPQARLVYFSLQYHRPRGAVRTAQELSIGFVRLKKLE